MADILDRLRLAGGKIGARGFNHVRHHDTKHPTQGLVPPPGRVKAGIDLIDLGIGGADNGQVRGILVGKQPGA